VNGVNAPAWMFVLPAVNDGENPSAPLGHGEPPGPEVILKLDDALTGAFPDHGVNDALVVYVPHSGGVERGARAPPKKCSLISSIGVCGAFSNVETSRPVTGSRATFPATFARTPEIGSSATRYIASSDPNGFAFCAAR